MTRFPQPDPTLPVPRPKRHMPDLGLAVHVRLLPPTLRPVTGVCA